MAFPFESVACEKLASQTLRSSVREFIITVPLGVMESKGKSMSWAQKGLELSTGKALEELFLSACLHASSLSEDWLSLLPPSQCQKVMASKS